MARKESKTWETEKAPFPSRLSEIMKEQKVSQEKLAGALGVKRQTVSLYKTGQSSPNAEQLCKIASFFGVSSDWLLGLSDVKSVDYDIRKIHEVTGLSEAALDCLVDQRRILLGVGVDSTGGEGRAINDLLSVKGGKYILRAMHSFGSRRGESRVSAESKIQDLERFIGENNISKNDAFPYVGDLRKEFFSLEKTESYERFNLIDSFVKLIDELYPAIDWDYYRAICDALDGMEDEGDE